MSRRIDKVPETVHFVEITTQDGGFARFEPYTRFEGPYATNAAARSRATAYNNYERREARVLSFALVPVEEPQA